MAVRIIKLSGIDFEKNGANVSSNIGAGRAVAVLDPLSLSEEEKILLPSPAGAEVLPLPCWLVQMENGTIEVVPQSHQRYWQGQGIMVVETSGFYPELPPGYDPHAIANWLGQPT